MSKKESAVWVTVHKNTKKRKSKLAGMLSISTCRELNRFCMSRAKDPDSICHICYVPRFMWQKALRKWLEFNYHVLHKEHHPDWVKEIDFKLKEAICKYARIESFGDVDCLRQCLNYLMIIRYVKEKQWGIWTKNPGPWVEAFEREGKPDNCTFGLSSNKFNEPLKINPNSRVVKYVDFVFTVYTKDYIAQHPEIKINCGGRQCAFCGLCYEKHDGIIYINELAK